MNDSNHFQPSNSKISLIKTAEFFKATISPVGFLSNVIFINFFLLIFIILASPLFYRRDIFGYGFLICIALTIFYLLFRICLGSLGKMKLEINEQKIALYYSVFGFMWNAVASRKKSSIQDIKIHFTNKKNKSYLVIYTTNKKYFVSNDSLFILTTKEVEWLSEELKEWLKIPSKSDNNTKNKETEQSKIKLKEKYINEQKQTKYFNSKALIYLNRAEINLHRKAYQAALKNCTKAIQFNPKYVEAYSCQGYIYYCLENYKEAEKSLARAIELNPQYAETYYYQGCIKCHHKKYEQGLKKFDCALNLNPNLVRVYCHKADVYNLLGEYHKALKNCDRTIQLDPKFIHAYIIKAGAYLKLEKYQLALENCNFALQLNSSFSDAYYYKGLSYLNLEQLFLAIKNFNQAISLSPNFHLAYVGRAFTHCSMTDYQATIKDCDLAIKINPQDHVSYSIKGRAYSYLGNLEQALKAFTQALSLSPSRDNYYNLATIQYLLGMAKSAMENLDRCLELDRGLESAYYYRANIFYNWGKKDKAIAEYQFAQRVAHSSEQTKEVNDDPQDEHGYYGRGLAKWRLTQDIEGAIQDLTTATKIAKKLKDIQFEQLVNSIIDDICSI